MIKSRMKEIRGEGKNGKCELMQTIVLVAVLQSGFSDLNILLSFPFL
jgi:hypothetical protein